MKKHLKVAARLNSSTRDGMNKSILIREVIDALGSQVEWDSENSTATIMMPEIDNKTYLPLRFVCENIGATVYWEEVGNKITIAR